MINQLKRTVDRIGHTLREATKNSRKKKPPTPEEYLERSEPFEAELFCHIRPEHVGVVFDVGACDALDSVRYSRLFPNAKVYAFEPLPTNVRQAKTNISRFNAERVKLIEKAISDEAGEFDFHVSSGHPSGYSLCEEWDFGGKSSSLLSPDRDKIQEQWSWLKFDDVIRVHTTTIDDFCSEERIPSIGFMHLDVQGAELKVLIGAKETLRSTTAIWYEVSSRQFYQNQSLHREIGKFMQDCGFKMVFKDGGLPQWDELWVR